jgi:hypothetical protein
MLCRTSPFRRVNHLDRLHGLARVDHQQRLAIREQLRRQRQVADAALRAGRGDPVSDRNDGAAGRARPDPQDAPAGGGRARTEHGDAAAGEESTYVCMQYVLAYRSPFGSVGVVR